MFSDYSSEVVEFRSCWRSKKKFKDHASQTSGILTYEVQTQTKKPKDVECQTQSLLELMEASISKSNESTQDEKQMLKFLKMVEPIVSKQLKINTAASSLYTGLFKQRALESEVDYSCEYILEEESMTSNKQSNCIEVTCVSWSSSGASVAAAYGTNEDVAWSDSRSCLCLWNLDRPKLDRRVCDQKLELESSIQVISFQPQFGGFIAAGLFSGMVLIWNMSTDEVTYSSSSHEDPVTCLSWLSVKNTKQMSLLSSSTDGKIILWRYRKTGEGTKMVENKQFEVKGAYLDRRAGHRGTGTVGITCMAIGNDLLSGGLASKRVFSTNNLLAVGCESGAVLKCNIEAVELNPVIFTYEAHVGPVYSVEWSSFHRHLFLTCSTDQTCRVYHSLQPAPLREIRPEEAVGGKDANYLFSACWSPTRPLLFYAVGTRGRMEACIISTSKSVSHCDVTDRNGKKCVVNSMVINQNRRSIIATGSSNGLVHVWRLGSQLLEPEDGDEEITAFRQLANEALAQD